MSTPDDSVRGRESAAGDVPAGGWLWGRWSGVAAAVVIVTFILDQAFKWWMIRGFGLREGQGFVVTPFMDIVYRTNVGVSYGLFAQNGPGGQYLLAAFSGTVAVAMWVWLARAGTSVLMGLSLGLIIGGALANALDRLHLGGVADFILLHAFGFSWYVFNIADVAIVAGVVGLLYDSWRTSRNDAANRA